MLMVPWSCAKTTRWLICGVAARLICPKNHPTLRLKIMQHKVGKRWRIQGSVDAV